VLHFKLEFAAGFAQRPKEIMLSDIDLDRLESHAMAMAAETSRRPVPTRMERRKLCPQDRFLPCSYAAENLAREAAVLDAKAAGGSVV
jgi:hypothetical protein